MTAKTHYTRQQACLILCAEFNFCDLDSVTMDSVHEYIDFSQGLRERLRTPHHRNVVSWFPFHLALSGMGDNRAM